MCSYLVSNELYQFSAFFFPGFIKSVSYIVVLSLTKPDLGGGLQKLAAEADPKSTAVRVFSGKKCVSFFPRSPYRGPYTISYFQKEERSCCCNFGGSRTAMTGCHSFKAVYACAILAYFCSKDSSSLRS